MKVGVVVVCGTAPIDGSAPNRVWFPCGSTDYGVVLTPMQLDVRPIVPREVCNWMYPARSFSTARAPALDRWARRSPHLTVNGRSPPTALLAGHLLVFGDHHVEIYAVPAMKLVQVCPSP